MDFAWLGDLNQFWYLKYVHKMYVDPEYIEKVFIQLAWAVAYIHSQGICHWDIKPWNVIVEPNSHIYLIDFGAAKSLDRDNNEESWTTTGNRGTINYMCPQLLRSHIPSSKAEKPRRGWRWKWTPYDPMKADMWSLGVTLYEFIFAKLPF